MSKFLNLLKAMGFSTAADAAVQVGISTDTQPRLQIDAGGKHTWGAGGSSSGDTTLYRSAANTLKTDDKFVTAAELSSEYSVGDEGGELQLAIPQTNTTLNTGVAIDVYQNKVRIYETGGSNRGAYIDLTAASTGVSSNLLAGGGGATTLDGLTDVTAPSPSTNDYLKWNGTAWVNDPIDLGTDTTGNYVASLVAGTGITLSNNSGEGATPTVSLSGVTTNAQTATYTLVLGDAGKMIEMNVGSANILYVPTNASVAFPVGTTIDILQTGSGKTQIAAVTSGTTTVNTANGAYLRAQWSAATLVKRATDTWVLFGDTSTT